MNKNIKIGLLATGFLAITSMSLFSNSFSNNYNLGSDFSSSVAQLSYATSGDMNQKSTVADVYSGFAANSTVNFASSTTCSSGCSVSCSNSCSNKCSNTCSTNSRCY